MAGHLAVRALAAETRQARDDEPRIGLEEVLRVEPESLEDARAERVDEDVGAPFCGSSECGWRAERGRADERLDERDAVGRLERDGDGLLAPAGPGFGSAVRSALLGTREGETHLVKVSVLNESPCRSTRTTSAPKSARMTVGGRESAQDRAGGTQGWTHGL